MANVTEPASVEVANLSPKADMGFFSDKPKAPVTVAASPQKPEPVKQTPPKDPVTGQFVKPEVVPPKERHTQESLDAAAYFGLSEDVVADIAPHKLNAMLIKMQNQQMQQMRQENLQRTFEASAARTAEVRPQEPQDEYAEYDGIDLGKDPETGNPISVRDLHPGLLRLLKAKLGTIDSTVKEIRQNEEKRLNTQIDDAVDEAFEAIASKEYYGEGGLHELTDEAAKQRRINIFKAAGIDVKADSAKKIAAKIKKAHELMYPRGSTPVAQSGYEQAAAAPAAPRYTEEDFAQGGLNPPTSRAQEELADGEEKAVRALEKRFGVKNGQKKADLGFFK